MRALLALVLETGNEEELMIREQLAFINVSSHLGRVEPFCMIGHDHECAPGKEEHLPQLRKAEFAIRVRAMNVNSAFEHRVEKR
jgi:hypothetical protein